MAKTNEFVSKTGYVRLKTILLAGEFPEVEFHVETSATGFKCEGYKMLEFNDVNSRFFTVLHDRLKGTEFPDGIFTSNRIKRFDFTDKVKRLVASITADDIRACTNRMKTWFG